MNKASDSNVLMIGVVIEEVVPPTLTTDPVIFAKPNDLVPVPVKLY